MKYLKLCDTDDFHFALIPAIRKLRSAATEFKAQTGRNGFEPSYFRGQSRVYCEYDSLYIPIEDALANVLSERADIASHLRPADRVRIFEQMS